MNEQPKLAVLIDAENVSNKYVKLIMDEVSNYGVLLISGFMEIIRIRAYLHG